MYRHHYSSVRGDAPSENVDILYRHSRILQHFKAFFKRIFEIYFAAFQDEKIYYFLNVNSSQKIKSKIIFKNFRSVFRIYLLRGRTNGLHDVYAIML